MMAKWDASLDFDGVDGAWNEQTARLGVSGAFPSSWMIPPAASSWDAVISTRGDAGSLPYGGNARIGLSGPLWGAGGTWDVSAESSWSESESYSPRNLRARATLDLGRM